MEYLSEASLLKLINSHLGDGFELETMLDPKSQPRLVKDFMDLWVLEIDKTIEKEYNENKYSDKYIDLFTKRGFTLREYRALFEVIDKDDWYRFPVYEFLQITDEYGYLEKWGRNDFIQKYTNDKKGYISLLLDQRLDCLEEFFSRIRPRLRVKDFLTHSYIVARTRSGKSEFMKVLVYYLLKEKKDNISLLIIDPHGDFAEDLIKLKRITKNLDKVVYIDPLLDSVYTPVINPFEFKKRDQKSLEIAADHLITTLKELTTGQELTKGMDRVIQFVIPAILEKEDATLYDLLRLIKGDEPLLKLGLNHHDHLVREFFNESFPLPKQVSTGLISRLERILARPIVRRFICNKTTFDLEEALNSGKIVIINTDYTKLGAEGSEAIGRFLISQLKVIGYNRPAKSNKKTIVFLDECQKFISSGIEEALSEMTKFGIHLVLAHQYKNQIEMGILHAMLANTELKIAGRNSAETISSLTGEFRLDADDLHSLKKYHFYIKNSDRETFKLKAPTFLLFNETNTYYIHDKVKLKEVNTYMIDKYYRESNGSKNTIKPKGEISNWDISEDIKY